MTSKIRWSLPDGVDELLPPKALQVETLRRNLVDKYIDSGYEFIIPPLLELSETIGGEAHDEIKSHAFSFNR
jgi:ATP phosphoribosyltransferase regulatory subunit